MTKYFLTFLLFISSFSSWANLSEHLATKTKNYDVLIEYYSDLLEHIKRKDPKSFCLQVKNFYEPLVQILNDDALLIQELYKVENPDYVAYASHLEENIASPLFSYGAHMDTCENSGPETVLELRQSMEYHVTNIDYLKLHHQMWVMGYETSSN